MKKILLIPLLVLALFSKAQNVLTKDSSISSANGITSTIITNYTYTNDCRVFQETQQRFDMLSNTYVNTGRTTYTYTSSGKTASTITENWNPALNAYTNQSKDSTIYDANNFTIEVLQYTWNTLTNAWLLNSKTDYFNNTTGLPDSSITSDYTSDKTTIRTHYTYNVSSRPTMILSDEYDSTNTLTLSLRSTYFYDSSNLVSTDSIYYEYKAPADQTFTPSSSTVIKHIYNPDGTLNESDVTITIFGLPIPTTSKTYYFYGPCSSVLPVTLFSFSGEQKSNNTILHWQTTNETNTSYFSIQRSGDAINFTNIGKVKAAGNSSVLKDYTFIDANIGLLNTQKLYYRMATTSNDGSISYSKIIPVSITAGKFIIAVSPNPFTNNIFVYVPVALQDAKLTISDINGKVLYTTAPHTLSGKLTIDVSNFAKGVYILSIQSDENKQVFKLVK
jgi:hypothetical protein